MKRDKERHELVELGAASETLGADGYGRRRRQLPVRSPMCRAISASLFRTDPSCRRAPEQRRDPDPQLS